MKLLLISTTTCAAVLWIAALFGHFERPAPEPAQPPLVPPAIVALAEREAWGGYLTPEEWGALSTFMEDHQDRWDAWCEQQRRDAQTNPSQ